MNRPIAISLFSGAGGLDLGFEQAGFDISLAIEKDPIHAATHAQNFPMWKTLNESVETIIPSDVREVVWNREIDVLIGGPPCQGFSIQGKRDPNDERSALLQEFIRLVDELRPKYFVLENVKGLTQCPFRSVLSSAIIRLQKLGYSLPQYKILNAKDYGVPQSRERLFLLGARNGLPLPAYPEPTGPSVTVSEALEDIPNVETVWYKGKGRLQNYSALMPRSAYALKLSGLDEAHWLDGHKREHYWPLLTNCQPTKHTEKTRDRFSTVAPGTRDSISHFPRLSANGVSPTLRAGTDSQRGRHTAPRPIHYLYPRCITVREMARLSGFPDWFRFDDRIWHGARQVGNAVPVPLAYAVAKEIMGAIRKTDKEDEWYQSISEKSSRRKWRMERSNRPLDASDLVRLK